MHQAPPVEYPLGDNRALRALCRAAWLTVLAVDLWWLLLADTQGSLAWLGLALTLLCGAVALRQWAAPLAGVLHWDGGGWSHLLGEQESAGEVAVHLDLQSNILVAWSPGAGRRRWCWLESRSEPSRWLALRRALYSPRHAEPGRDEASGPATGAHA